MAAEQVLAEIDSKLAEMDRVIAECEARLGERARMLDHPILGPLTASESRRFHWAHGQHHVKQIWKLRGK
jgi:hypothetical protein